MSEKPDTAEPWRPEVSTVVGLGALAMILILSGPRAAFDEAIEDYAQYGQILAATAPLNLTVALSSYLLTRRADESDSLALSVFSIIAICLAGNFAGNALLRVLGRGEVVTEVSSLYSEQLGFFEIPVRYFVTYYVAFGAASFWASVVGGGILGWVAARAHEWVEKPG